MSRKEESVQPRGLHQRACGGVWVPGVYEAARRMLCSKDFALTNLIPHTVPEMARTPLDELILQIGLLYEQRRDKQIIAKGDEEGSRPAFVPGFRSIKFLSQPPSPPTEQSLVQAYKHLLEVGALAVVQGNGEQYE